MTDLDLDELLSVAHQAADLARDMFLTTRPGHATAKGERDYATELDYSVEKAVRDFLHQAAPRIGFLGEEGGHAGNGLPGVTYWALDPVDGTANLMHGLPLCGTSLGLLHHGQPVLGVIDLPHLAERFHAHQGGGAFRNGQPINASRTSRLDQAVISVGDFAVGPDANRRNQQRHAIVRELSAHVERVRMLGSAAIDLAWVAAGRLDASIMLSNKPWDVAAGIIVAREAGAVVLDRDGTYHQPASSATIASSPELAPAVVDLIARTAEYAST